MDLGSDQSLTVVRLQDYRPPGFLIDSTELIFEIFEEYTEVSARLEIRRNPANAQARVPLELDGEELESLELAINGKTVTDQEIRSENHPLILDGLGDEFILTSKVRIRPHLNHSLMGLYKSSGNFCTQCEAEGFRKITWFLDRPDVLSVYTVTIIADPGQYPVMLSNGNQVESYDLADGRRKVVWHDPWPKPSYLFALVAGDLGVVTDTFTTCSGRQVALRVFAEHHNIDKCDHAMASLKKSMAWDEQVYGREYDLDVYMIVAVDDFNMGAMENKGLNIFNSKYVLAKPQTATDADYQGIEGVIAHEYFHNWSGNRVTCRDWFQLSLKEGFTVFRDQEFSADMTSRGVKRIADVNILRTHQFREDAGPMAHPVRPDSYMEINNFYTVTVYNKGAEVVRMIHNLLGGDRFRKGTDLYFQRHDGQAVTTEEFIVAMEDANGVELKQFRNWYSQAGTPVIGVEESFEDGVLELTLSQSCAPTADQKEKLELHIPVVTALLDQFGRHMPINSPTRDDIKVNDADRTAVLELKKNKQTWRFTGLESKPLVSLLRGFSAPVILNQVNSARHQALLMAVESDHFNRWDAAQSFANSALADAISAIRHGQSPKISAEFLTAWGRLLNDTGTDPALISAALKLPSEALLAEAMEVANPQVIHQARRFALKKLAETHHDSLRRRYMELGASGDYKIDAASVAARSLRNTCLALMLELKDEDFQKIALIQYQQSDNMTDSLAALTAIANTESVRRQSLLDDFYQRWRKDSLVVDKWLSLQATMRAENSVELIRSLMAHRAFNMKNPNKVRSLLGAFALANPAQFHRQDGSGYRLIGDAVMELDEFNPQVAARLAASFLRWRKYDDNRQAMMKRTMEAILGRDAVSKDVAEIVGKSLG